MAQIYAMLVKLEIVLCKIGKIEVDIYYCKKTIMT